MSTAFDTMPAIRRVTIRAASLWGRACSRSSQLRQFPVTRLPEHGGVEGGQHDEPHPHCDQHVAAPSFDQRAARSDRAQDVGGHSGHNDRGADEQTDEHGGCDAEGDPGLFRSDGEALGRQTGEKRARSAEACEKVSESVDEIVTSPRLD